MGQLNRNSLDRLIAQREDETRQYYQRLMTEAQQPKPRPLTLEERISMLVDIRTREGYMAHWRTGPDGSYLLLENHCPICATPFRHISISGRRLRKRDAGCDMAFAMAAPISAHAVSP